MQPSISLSNVLLLLVVVAGLALLVGVQTGIQLGQRVAVSQTQVSASDLE